MRLDWCSTFGNRIELDDDLPRWLVAGHPAAPKMPGCQSLHCGRPVLFPLGTNAVRVRLHPIEDPIGSVSNGLSRLLPRVVGKISRCPPQGGRGSGTNENTASPAQCLSGFHRVQLRVTMETLRSTV